MAIRYISAQVYLEEATTLQDRVAKIESIINGLLVLAATATEGELYEEYSLDDGQTKIQARYRGHSSIMAAIKGWESVKWYYLNRLMGRSVTLVNGKNMPGCY